MSFICVISQHIPRIQAPKLAQRGSAAPALEQQARSLFLFCLTYCSLVHEGVRWHSQRTNNNSCGPFVYKQSPQVEYAGGCSPASLSSPATSLANCDDRERASEAAAAAAECSARLLSSAAGFVLPERIVTAPVCGRNDSTVLFGSAELLDCAREYVAAPVTEEGPPIAGTRMGLVRVYPDDLAW